MAKWAGSLHISILKAAKINKKTNIAKYFCPFCKKNYINIQTYIYSTDYNFLWNTENIVFI